MNLAIITGVIFIFSGLGIFGIGIMERARNNQFKKSESFTLRDKIFNTPERIEIYKEGNVIQATYFNKKGERWFMSSEGR